MTELEERQRRHADWLRKTMRIGGTDPDTGEPELTDERRGQIIRLLETRDECLPTIRTASIQTPSGFVHRTVVRLSCPDCLANDRVPTPGCETCAGRGYLEERRDRDPYAHNDVEPFGWDQNRHDAARARDREIDLMERQTAKPTSAADEIAEANANPYLWERLRRKMWRTYDYGPVDAGLDILRISDISAYQQLHAVYVYGWNPHPVGLAREACERGIWFLHRMLPAELRAPDHEPPARVAGRLSRGAGAKARMVRDEEIVRHIDAGVATSDVADAVGLSVSQVNRIYGDVRR